MCVGGGLGKCWAGGRKGNLNAITDVTLLYLCGKTELGHTFLYLYVYLGDSIQVGSLERNEKSRKRGLREKQPTGVNCPFGFFI